MFKRACRTGGEIIEVLLLILTAKLLLDNPQVVAVGAAVMLVYWVAGKLASTTAPTQCELGGYPSPRRAHRS